MFDESLENQIREQEILLFGISAFDDQQTLKEHKNYSVKKEVLFNVKIDYKTGKCEYILRK